MTLIQSPNQQIINACDSIKPKLTAGSWVTPESPCNHCGDTMKGNCNAYGGCIYMDWHADPEYVPDTASQEQGVRAMIAVGQPDGLPYLLTRAHDDLKGFDAHISRIMRGWGVTLEGLASIMHDTGNITLIRKQAIYLAKRDQTIRCQTGRFIPELEALARTADQNVAAYASETMGMIKTIQSWQDQEDKDLLIRMIFGSAVALAVYAGISYLFVGVDKDGTSTSYTQSLLQLSLPKIGFSGMCGLSITAASKPWTQEPFNPTSEW